MMPLGTEVGLGPGDVVLDGDPVPPKRGTPPDFGSCLLWPNAWMDEDATWTSTQATLCETEIQLPREKGTAAPSFRPMSIVATVAHLSYC